MAANRYDLAALMPIINTYVPIDFGELYRIGATLQEAIKQAEKDFGEALLKFSEFYSPSDIDTTNWYNLTINRKDVLDLLNRMVNDPDAIKDAAFRSSLSGAINRTDYASLGKLKQSRAGMLTRQEANQRLMLAGKFNPLIHNVDYANYDTLRSGIYNDTTPLPYTSVIDMVRPYVDDLKDSFMGILDGWIHRGVSPERTDQLIQANWSNIVNTPGYSLNLEIIMKQNPGISQQDAINRLNNLIILAGREFTRDNPERDPWDLYKKKKEYEAESNPNPITAMKNLTELVHEDLSRRFRANYGNFSDPEDKARYLEFGVNGLSEKGKKELEQLISPLQILKENHNRFLQLIDDLGDPIEAAKALAFSTHTKLGDRAAQIYTQQAAGTNKQYSDGSYEVANIKTLTPLDRVGFSMAGVSELSESIYRFAFAARDRLWNSLNLLAKLLPAGEAISDNNNAKNVAYAFVPYSQVSKYMTDEEIALVKATVERRSFDEVSTSQTTKFDYSGNVDNSSTVIRGKMEDYVRFPVTSNIPSRGQASIEADALFNQEIGLSSTTRDEQVGYSQFNRSSIYDINSLGLQ